MRKLLLVVTLVAAGAAVLPTPPASPADPGPTYVEGVSFDEPVRMQYQDPAQIGGPGEPSIKVDSAGTIYVAGVCCVARAAPAWYSQDGGKTFPYLPSPGGAREIGLGAEGDFIVDDADGVYFVDTWVPSLFFTRWSDNGDVWEYTEDTTIGVIPGLDDRPWLAYTHGDVYLYVNHGTHISVYRSDNGGHAWEESFTTLGRGQRYWTGHVAADRRTGSAYLFGANCEQGQMCAAATHDGGETWTEVAAGTLPRGGLAPFMVASAVDGAGNVYGTFADINQNGCDVYLAVSSDRGQTWRQFRVNPEDGCSTFPWVAAGDDGRVALSWYHNPAPKHQNQVPATSEWRLKAAVVTDATSDTPTVTHGTLGRVIHRGALNRELWDFQQIDVGPDGRFHIAAAEDHEAPCAGTLSAQGGLAAYQNMCTTYVGQAGGPRAITHAADATSVHAVEVASTGSGVSVSGSVTFGRAAPAEVIDDEAGDATPEQDILSGQLARTRAGSEELVLELAIDSLPEVVNGTGSYTVWLNVDGERSTVNLNPRPRFFQVCPDEGECTPIRGDADAGGDRLVAHVPLDLLGATPGSEIRASAQAYPGAMGVPGVTLDSASGDPFSVPEAGVTVTVRDGSGAEVAASPAALSPDLSSFDAALDGLAPGSYTVEVEACFGGNCEAAATPVTVG